MGMGFRAKHWLALVVASLPLVAWAGKDFVPPAGVAIDERTLLPIPAAAQAGLLNRDRAKFYYTPGYWVRPNIYKKLSRGRYTPVSLGHLKINHQTNASDLRCLYVFLTGSPECLSAVQLRKEISNVNPKNDLLPWARSATKRLGLAQTRDILASLLKARDSEGGKLETNLLRATRSPAWSTGEAVLDSPSMPRRRVGIFFFMGIDVMDQSPNREQIRLASQYAQELGFYAHTFQTGPTDSSLSNAKVIHAQLKTHLAQVDSAVIVAASKGVADFLTWTFLHSHEYPRTARDKIRLVLSLSGAIRESFVADWLFSGKDFYITHTRFIVKTFRKKFVAGFSSLATSPWTHTKSPKILKQRLPNLRWISFAMLPEGLDGLSYLDKWNVGFQEHVYRNAHHRSPSDGLLESAASILPPGTDVPEHVIRGWGPHALSLGHYADDTPIAPRAQRGKVEAQPESGPELLNAFMRAIPSTWIAPQVVR